MAYCSGCPYRWHDSDCEYCSARNDEIIDTKSYSKSTCPYYQEYAKSKGESVSSGASADTAEFTGKGCLLSILVVVGILLFVLVNNNFYGLFDGKQSPAYSAEDGRSASVTADSGLNLREAPNTSSQVILTMPKGSEVTVLKTEDGWCYIAYKDAFGWCSADYLDIE